MKKILIIEDDQIVANIYRNKLAVEGFQVEVALDGPVGLELVQIFRPDVVLLDLMLPQMTGVEWMKKVRMIPDFEHLPIIVFSNTYLTAMVQEAWKAGATKCLSKSSCTPKHVLEVVRSTFPNSEAQKAAGKTMPAVMPAPTPSAAMPKPLNGSNRMAATAADAEFQSELRRSFVDSLPSTLAALRTLLTEFVKAENEQARLKKVNELYRRIHSVTSNAGLAGVMQIAQMADALEALLKELYEKPKNINSSTMRTVATGIDFLATLFERSSLPETKEVPASNILVVDDEAISRRAVTHSLEKARLKSVNVEDPKVAYEMLMENKFDLIFLDVDMPGMNGFELCTKLRTLPAHKKTPVVFVTSLTDFESRANSTVAGGSDFIAKPFLFIELAVKALVYVLKGRLSNGAK
jgi:CheY-like chemotaxis protein